MTKKELVKAAKELQTLTECSPPIDFKAPEADLKAEILATAEILHEEDDPSKTTLAVIEALKEEAPAADEETAEPADAKKTAATTKKPAAKKEPAKGLKVPTLTRQTCVVDAITKKAQTLDEIAGKADAEMVKAGKTSNLKQTTDVAKAFLPVLAYAGVFEIDADGKVKKA
jgi:hypothetical protein